MKRYGYEIEKNVERLRLGKCTGFLTADVVKLVCSRLKKQDYEIFYPYDDADKVILYAGEVPEISVYKIVGLAPLRHSAILGSLFGLNISGELFGDIIFYRGCFYVFLLREAADLIVNELVMIGNQRVKLEEVMMQEIADYVRQYEKIEMIVSSLRMDSVAARIIGCNRDVVRDRIRDKEIIVNYEVIAKGNYVLKVGDVFSIRGCGKFLFDGIIGMTKKDNYILGFRKYI